MDDLNTPNRFPRPLSFLLGESIKMTGMIPWDETTDANGGPALSLTTTVIRLYEPQGCLALFCKPRRVASIDITDQKNWKLYINNKRDNKTLRTFADLLEEKYSVSIERVYKSDS